MSTIEITAPDSIQETVVVDHEPTSDIYYRLAMEAEKRGADTQQSLKAILQHRRDAAALRQEADMFAANEHLLAQQKIKQIGYVALEKAISESSEE